MFCCCSVSVLQRLSRPNLRLFFDVIRYNYSNIAFLSCTSLLRHKSPNPFWQHTPPLSLPTVPFHAPDYDIYSSRLKQQSVRGSLSFEVDVSQLMFLSWARALTPDLQWLLPWRSQAEITVNAGLWYLLESGRLSLKGNTIKVRHLSMCVHTDRQTDKAPMAEVKETWLWLPDKSCDTMIF